MFKTIRKLSLVLGLVVSVAMTAGCVPLIVGAAAGASGYAYIRGELVKQYDVSASELHQAAMRGVKDLGLSVSVDQSDRLSGKIRAKFSDGKNVKINTVAITEETAQLKIRVGLFGGDKLRSEMVLTAVEKHL